MLKRLNICTANRLTIGLLIAAVCLVCVSIASNRPPLAPSPTHKPKPSTQRKRLTFILIATAVCLSWVFFASDSPSQARPPTYELPPATHLMTSRSIVTCPSGLPHLSWVWEFSRDGSPEDIVRVLKHHNLGVIMKTHDGTNWMATYDLSPTAVTGPEQVRLLAQHFEEQGVPFHAWALVKGVDPILEAQMAAQVLDAGARSITLDLEPSSEWPPEFWQSTPEAAVAFGQELRRLKPDAVVITAVDPRPWAIPLIPLPEFASFSNALAPMAYWAIFSDQAHLELYGLHGFPPGPDGITPEFVLDVSANVLKPYNLPIQPVGDGSSADPTAWTRFLNHASRTGMSGVSVWRQELIAPQVLALLKNKAPRIPCDAVENPSTTDPPG